MSDRLPWEESTPWFRYSSVDYPNTAAATTGGGWCDVTWPELVWSAVTVGRARRDLFRYPPFSFYEMIYRAAIVYANLKSSTASALEKTRAYVRLDPSEKSAISYFLGLTFAKVLSDRFLATPWLLHLDVYGDEFSVETWPGRTRPDLFGRDTNGNWVVFESKGRTGRYDERAFATAKNQTSYVRTINGVAPQAKVASEVFFSRDVLTVRMEDPPDASKDARDISISDEKFFSAYYEPFTELLASAGPAQIPVEIGGDRFRGVAIEHADLQIGVSENVLSLLEQRNFDQIFELSRSIVSSEDSLAPVATTRKLGRDGVLVILGRTWVNRLMAAEPEERSHEIGPRSPI